MRDWHRRPRHGHGSFTFLRNARRNVRIINRLACFTVKRLAVLHPAGRFHFFSNPLDRPYPLLLIPALVSSRGRLAA